MAVVYLLGRTGVISGDLIEDFLISRFADGKVAPDNPPYVPPAATTQLTPSETKKLGNLASRADEKLLMLFAPEVAMRLTLERLAHGRRKHLPKQQKLQREETRLRRLPLKIAKQAGRLGQKN